MFGPTVGDKVRLADTELFIEVEKDFTVYGEEVKFGGGKVIRDGMGQSQQLAAEVADTIITNARKFGSSGVGWWVRRRRVVASTPSTAATGRVA